jgi:hypothetical protein
LQVCRRPSPTGRRYDKRYWRNPPTPECLIPRAQATRARRAVTPGPAPPRRTSATSTASSPSRSARPRLRPRRARGARGSGRAIGRLRDETCPLSTERWTRRVHSVRRDGRDVSTLYGREGGGGAPRVLLLTGRPRAALGPPARRTSLTGRGPQALCPCEISFLMRSSFFEILKRSRSSRTKWTRLVPRPVLTGHASSLLPY